ncbi:MAG: hypothetical protein S4CHLAM45_13940 [Chlamydiales bacterium]|nr:hypothetical protein [Chlamydiales bacterium]MCH9620499.1 hypothetical protein [Chlamydiales bacterium]MCH9623484.1 hypothetical protein [Chlamydiales bacterium]
MRRFLFASIIAMSVCSSCARSYRDTSLYQKTGQVKPIVSVMPVINSSKVHDLTWNLSKEFTDEIRKRVFDSSKLYLLREGGAVEYVKELNDPNPVNLPVDAKEQLGAAEYVIVAEFLDQHETPYGLANRPNLEHVGSVLSLAMRVRVIDLRKEKPRVILQEVIDYDHIVAKPYLNTDYTKVAWGTDPFEQTPLGLAHSKIVRDLVAHAESYIVAAH